MGINMRKVKIINNTGAVNVGDCYNIAPFAVSKAYAGAGGSSAAIFFKWKKAATRGDSNISISSTIINEYTYIGLIKER